MRSYRDQPSGTVSRARTLRRDATPAERQLWSLLRVNFPNSRFRRQVPIGPYFADFLCFSAKLIIEVDGGQHGEPGAAAYDARRSAFLAEQGYRVIRFWNADVLAQPDGVVTMIATALSSATSPSPSRAPRGPLPLPVGEGTSE